MMAYPLPNITEILIRSVDDEIYSVLEPAWGFGQINLIPVMLRNYKKREQVLSDLIRNSKQLIFRHAKRRRCADLFSAQCPLVFCATVSVPLCFCDNGRLQHLNQDGLKASWQRRMEIEKKSTSHTGRVRATRID
ncbi:unnamed protein product [Trichogramma brassicae]|uniref:Uncharacterized protein n=1 Tax=Trichogramma brassicae TaxID=86971 RepID=A0A6H5I023_9HYME|nr:unnamed protein product [Trichogramma brassicae]